MKRNPPSPCKTTIINEYLSADSADRLILFRCLSCRSLSLGVVARVTTDEAQNTFLWHAVSGTLVQRGRAQGHHPTRGRQIYKATNDISGPFQLCSIKMFARKFEVTAFPIVRVLALHLRFRLDFQSRLSRVYFMSFADSFVGSNTDQEWHLSRAIFLGLPHGTFKNRMYE